MLNRLLAVAVPPLLARDYNAVADWPQFRGPQACRVDAENRWPLNERRDRPKCPLANTSAGFGARLTHVSGESHYVTTPLVRATRN